MSSQKGKVGQPLTTTQSNLEEKLARIEVLLFGRPVDDFLTEMSSSETLLRLWQMIEQQYSDQTLRADRLAQGSGASPSTLTRLARAVCDFPAYQLLRRYRTLKAVDLLLTTDMPALDVALAVGFGSGRSLERACASMLDLSPTGLRRCKERLDRKEN